MHLFSSIDWGFLEAFFGEWGKLVTSAVGLVAALITLVVVLFKYLRAKILEKERAQARADLEAEKTKVRQQQQALEAKEADLNRKDAALQIAAVRLTDQEKEIDSRERK